MAFQRKAGAPYVLDLGTAMAEQVVGTDAAWLGGFIPFLGQTIVDVTSMCKAGPPPDAEWNAGDMLAFTNPVSGVMAFQKMQRVATSVIFPAYCESTAAIETCGQVGGYSGELGANSNIFEAIIPAGAVSVELTLESGGTTRLVLYAYAGDTFIGDVNGSIGTEFTAGVPQSFSWSSSATKAAVNLHDADPTFRTVTMKVCMTPSTTIPFLPPPQPPGVILPPSTTGSTDITGLARDLAALKTQLGIVQDMLGDLAAFLQLQGSADGQDPTAPAADVTTDLTGAKGFVIDVEGFPDYLGSEPGNPTRHFRIGRYVIGFKEGLGSSVQLEFPQTVVEPLPLGATSVNVHVWPPMLATVTKLVEVKKLPPPAP